MADVGDYVTVYPGTRIEFSGRIVGKDKQERWIIERLYTVKGQLVKVEDGQVRVRQQGSKA